MKVFIWIKKIKKIYIFTYMFTSFFCLTYFSNIKSCILLSRLILNPELLTPELFSDSLILRYNLSSFIISHFQIIKNIPELFHHFFKIVW